jgi:aldehyde:ferredoxin oxidoreductase
MYLPEIPALAEELSETSSQGKARFTIACQDFGTFFSSCAVFCNLGAVILNATQAVDMVNHVTGFDCTIEDLTNLGRRIWYLKRGLSNLFGATAEHDRLPGRLLTPMKSGPTQGSVPDMDLMLKEFYELRGFHDSGVPRKEVLENMGLSELAELLHRKA